MTTVVVSQSNYLPWKGYFDLIRRADHLVLLENVQFTRRDWRSRNRIKCPTGVQWLSVPVHAPKGRQTSVAEAEILDPDWPGRHLRALELSYRRTPHFDSVFGILSEVLQSGHKLLSELNEHLLTVMLDYLGLNTRISAARGPIAPIDPSQRILDIVQSVGGLQYLSGPAADAYLDVSRFREVGVEVAFMAYPEYSEYPQVWPPFRHDVSMIDVLFHLGTEWQHALEGGHT